MKLPSSGWIPGEKHILTGPSLKSGAIAPQLAPKFGPSTTAGFVAMMRVASWTSIWGFD